MMKLRWQHYVIAIVVATQMLIPLHYYLVRRDPHDERFAWRMFSPMRMSTCRPAFFKDEQPLPLAAEFHEAWVNIASRGRFTVLEAMAARLCAKYPGAAIRLELSCEYVGARTASFGGYDMCQVPTL
jgi:hypothetical protein